MWLAGADEELMCFKNLGYEVSEVQPWKMPLRVGPRGQPWLPPALEVPFHKYVGMVVKEIDPSQLVASDSQPASWASSDTALPPHGAGAKDGPPQPQFPSYLWMKSSFFITSSLEQALTLGLGHSR